MGLCKCVENLEQTFAHLLLDPVNCFAKFRYLQASKLKGTNLNNTRVKKTLPFWMNESESVVNVQYVVQVDVHMYCAPRSNGLFLALILCRSIRRHLSAR